MENDEPKMRVVEVCLTTISDAEVVSGLNQGEKVVLVKKENE